MRRLLVRVARRLGLLGPFERLHRIETSVEELRASHLGLHQKADRLALDMQILLAGLNETANGTRTALLAGLNETANGTRTALLAGLNETADRIELRVISQVVEALAMEVSRLDSYLVHHVAMLEAAIALSRREGGATAAAISEIGPKLEAEFDRLDGNIVHHVGLLRALGERAATAQDRMCG
jgi:hypothetical protein